MPVFQEDLLIWLSTGLEVTRGVTLSVCCCVHVSVWPCSFSSGPPWLFIPQTHVGFMGGCRIWSLSPWPQPLPLSPHPAQCAHRAEESLDPPPLPQPLWLTRPLLVGAVGWQWRAVRTRRALEARQTGSLLLLELVKHCPRPVR